MTPVSNFDTLAGVSSSMQKNISAEQFNHWIDESSWARNRVWLLIAPVF